MSDNIDIPIEASGEDGVNRLISALDRLHGAMEKLGNTSALDRLASQMEIMQATMVTGFANLSATSEKMLGELGNRQARALQTNGEKSVEAIEAAGLKLKAADARTWEQIQRGSASNVTQAFHQLAQGIPVEAVRARMGEMAAATALSLDGQVEKLRQFQENTKSLYATNYKPMAGATEAQLAEAAAMNARFDAARAARQNALSEEAAAKSWQNYLDLDAKKSAADTALAARQAALSEEAAAKSFLVYLELDAKKTAADSARAARQRQLDESSAAASWQTYLDLEAKKTAEAAAFEDRVRRLAESSQAASFMAFLDNEAKKEATEAARIARTRSLTEASEAASFRNFLDLEAQKLAAAERQRALNTNFLTASPTSQLNTARQAQVYLAQPGATAQAAAERYGTVALTSDTKALEAAVLAASAAKRAGVGASLEAASAEGVLSGALKQAEGAFRGAAHQAGIYGFHHGQLIALLAGGGAAAALHHIAATGAEVEFALANLNALGDKTNQRPLDFDKFIGITAGTMSNLNAAAEGVHALAEAGFSAEKAMAALPDIMRLASLGNMSVAQAAEMAVESMHAFGKEATDIGAIGDILVAVGSKSNVSVHKLAEDMKSAATTGELFNLSMQEITATVGTLAERGLTIQPLSSALMKLYEPSAKVRAEMERLNLSTKDGEGGLKSYTEFMGELQAKISQFKAPADELKNLGFSSRDIKSMQVMTQHWDDYIHLLHEAENAGGKMFDAMTVKEDTVEGAFLRMKSTFEGSVVKAFENANPAIREVEQSLMNMAGSKTTIDLLSGLATGAARLTEVLLENAKAVGIAVVAYAGLRVLSGLTALASEFAAAKVRQAAAATAAAAAATVEAERLALLTVEERAAAVGAATLATTTEAAAVALNTAAISMKTVTAAAGWIGIAIVAATTAYEFFRGAISDADRDRMKAVSTIDTTIDAYAREISRLKELEEQLRQTGKTGMESALQVGISQTMMERAEAHQALSDLEKAKPKTAATALMLGHTGVSQDIATREWDQKHNEALDLVKTLDDRMAKLDEMSGTLESHQNAVAGMQGVANLKKKIEEFPDVVVPALKTKAAQEAADAANRELKELRAQEVTQSNLVALQKVALDVEKQIRATKLDAKPAGANSGANDALNAELRTLQNQLDIKRQIAQAEMTIAQRQNKRGEIGDLELINVELNSKLAVDKLALDIAQKQYDLASAADKLSKGAKYQGNIGKAKAQVDLDKDDAEDKRRSVLERMRQDELHFESQTLADKGQLVNSYLVEFDAKYSKVISQVTHDLWATDDPAQAAALVSYLQFLDKLKEAGKNAAVGKELVNGFALEIDKLHLQIQTLTENSGEGAGLGAIFDNAARAEQAYAASLPGLIAQQKQLQDLSDKTGSTHDQKAALDAAKAVNSEASKARNVWVEMAKTIGTSLEQAFGRGGKAIGGLGTAMAVYDARRKQIQESWDKSAQAPADLAKKQLDTQSAQIENYASMAGAAKGFFNENSSGYKLMEGMEKGFRILQIAGMMESLYTHLFVTATKATATVSGQAVETGAVVTGEAARNTAKIPGVFMSFMSALGPYGAAAAAVAIAAVLGGAFSGGGGVDTAKNRQAANGTGTVLGDPKAKSESISKSLDAIEKNTYQGLSVSIGMLDALRGIQAGIGGMGALMARNGAVGTEMVPNRMGTLASFMGSNTGNLTFGGPLALAANAITGGWIGKQTSQIANRIFGGKETSLDTGVMSNSSTLGAAAHGGLQLSQFNDIKKDGGWFSSDKYSTQTAALGSETDSQVAKVMAGLRSGIIAAADALGQGGDAFIAQLDNIPVAIEKISTKGMTNDEVEKALNSAFSKTGDQLASQAVGGMQQYALAGEGALETLMRVASDFQTVTVVFQSFGKVGNLSIAARERLIELSGGLSEFTSQADSFLKDFYTSAEQAASLRSRIAPTLAQYGLSAAGDEASAKMFRNFIVGLDTSTEAGAQAYAALMKIEPAFKSIVDATKDVTDEARGMQDQIDEILMTRVQLLEKERAALDPVNRALFDQLQLAKQVTTAREALNDAYDTERQNLESNIDRVKQLGESWKKFRDGLLLGANSPLTPQQKYEESRAQFEKTLAAARGGDTTAQAGYESAANNFIEASRIANASGAQYTNDFAEVLAATDDSIKWAEQQVDVGKSSLQALQDSVANLIDIKGAVLSVHDAIVQLAEATRLASVAPNLTPTATMPEPTSVFYTAENDVARNTAPGMTEQQAAQVVTELAGLRKDQAQQATDQINATVQAAVAAAKEMAEGMIEAERTRNYKQRLATDEALS